MLVAQRVQRSLLHMWGQNPLLNAEYKEKLRCRARPSRSRSCSAYLCSASGEQEPESMRQDSPECSAPAHPRVLTRCPRALATALSHLPSGSDQGCCGKRCSHNAPKRHDLLLDLRRLRAQHATPSCTPLLGRAATQRKRSQQCARSSIHSNQMPAVYFASPTCSNHIQIMQVRFVPCFVSEGPHHYTTAVVVCPLYSLAFSSPLSTRRAPSASAFSSSSPG